MGVFVRFSGARLVRGEQMMRGVRPTGLDQPDGMCIALGVDTGEPIEEAEAALENYDFVPHARLIFVDDGLRLGEPIVTTG